MYVLSPGRPTSPNKLLPSRFVFSAESRWSVRSERSAVRRERKHIMHRARRGNVYFRFNWLHQASGRPVNLTHLVRRSLSRGDRARNFPLVRPCVRCTLAQLSDRRRRRSTSLFVIFVVAYAASVPFTSAIGRYVPPSCKFHEDRTNESLAHLRTFISDPHRSYLTIFVKSSRVQYDRAEQSAALTLDFYRPLKQK